jgi:hypothetical protein
MLGTGNVVVDKIVTCKNARVARVKRAREEEEEMR